jgi:hypothetical protein
LVLDYVEFKTMDYVLAAKVSAPIQRLILKENNNLPKF